MVRISEMSEICDFKEDIVSNSSQFSKGNVINLLWMVQIKSVCFSG